MTHYELFIYYLLGHKPAEVARTYGYSRGTCYRMFRNYRKALKTVSRTERQIQRDVSRIIEKAQHNLILLPIPVVSKRENKPNNLDH